MSLNLLFVIMQPCEAVETVFLTACLSELQMNKQMWTGGPTHEEDYRKGILMIPVLLARET
jgi:hypothetical protein